VRGAFTFGHINVDQGTDLFGQANIGGEQEDGDLGLGLAHFLGDFATMHSGHGVVEDDGVDWLGGEEFQAGVAVGAVRTW
jgi:hypothetical protein